MKLDTTTVMLRGLLAASITLAAQAAPAKAADTAKAANAETRSLRMSDTPLCNMPCRD